MNALQIEFPLAVAVCAWCRPNELGAAVGEVSHGICLRHLRKLRLDLQKRAVPPKQKKSAPAKLRPVTLSFF
jgi:hypothetical protein